MNEPKIIKEEILKVKSKASGEINITYAYNKWVELIQKAVKEYQTIYGEVKTSRDKRHFEKYIDKKNSEISKKVWEDINNEKTSDNFRH